MLHFLVQYYLIYQEMKENEDSKKRQELSLEKTKKIQGTNKVLQIAHVN